MRKRIRRKREKQSWVRGFGAVKATRRFVYEVRGGRLRKSSVTLLHFPAESETRTNLQYIEKIPIRVFPR